MLANTVQVQVEKIIVAGGLLVGALIVLWLGVWYYRRRWLGSEASGVGPAWTLEDLRRLRDRGDLSESEYQALRGLVVGSFEDRPAGAAGLPESGDSRTGKPGF